MERKGLKRPASSSSRTPPNIEKILRVLMRGPRRRNHRLPPRGCGGEEAPPQGRAFPATSFPGGSTSIIVLGGDGTLLSIAHLAAVEGRPGRWASTWDVWVS